MIAARLIVMLFLVGDAVALARVDTQSELAREHFKEGMKLYRSERYDDAIIEFDTAFKIKADAAFIYNIAQCHRLAGRPDKALLYYQSFILMSSDRALRPRVEEYAREMEAAVAAKKRAAALPDASHANPAPGARSGAAATSMAGSGVASRGAADEARAARRRALVAPLCLVGAGLILGGVGLGFGFAARSAAATVEGAGTPARPVPFSIVADVDARGRTDAVVAYVLFGAAGAAGIAAGAVALAQFLAHRGGASATRVSFAPAWFGNAAAGASLVGNF